MRKINILVIIVCLSASLFFAEKKESIKPPDIQKKKHVTEIHGYKLVDNYYWLRNRDNQEVINYIKRENQYTKKMMSHTEKLQKNLYEEMIARIDETDLTVPEKYGDYYYYSRTEKGKQYRIYCRKKKSLKAEEEIILDVNKLAEGHDYYDIGFFKISPDHSLIAYSRDITGAEKYELRIKNLKTGNYLEDNIENIDSFQWANDNKTFFYTLLDESERPYKLYRHKLGRKQSEDKLLFTEKDDKYWMWLEKSKSNKYIFLELGSKTTSEVHFLNANNPDDDFKLIKKREKGVEYYPYHSGKYFYIYTNKNAYNFKIARTKINKYKERNWKDYISHKNNVYIEDVEAFQNFLVLSQRNNSYKKLAIVKLDTKDVHNIDFPEEIYNYWLGNNYQFDTEKLRLTYTSYITPKTVYDYDMESKTLKLRKKYNVKNYDKTNYKSERIFIESHDGAKVPLTLVYKKDISLKNKPNPLLLHGYGAYGSSMDPYFSYSRLSLLKRNIIYAVAHVRGGAEKGQKWYKQGKLLNKKNSFRDFIACAESLIGRGYTSNDKIVISGGSAGGLLIGAVLNMRPELFHGAVLSVPFVDVINTMLDSSLPLTVVEYEEWGNPNKKKYFKYMLSYSPYDNIKEADYPNILVTGGLNDPRVKYWEPVKYVAKMRDFKKGNSKLLLDIKMGTGHMGSSGRYSYYRDTAFEYSFILDILNMID